MKMKSLAAVALTLSLCLAAAYTATASSPLDLRRTAFVPFGNRVLIFEAPREMCFFDESKKSQKKIVETMRVVDRKQGRGELMAAFTDCYRLDSFGVPSGDPSVEPILGAIRWMNPYIGDRSKMEQADYLDMREAEMPVYAGKLLKGYSPLDLDEKATRATDGVSLAFRGESVISYQKRTTTGVISSMIIDGYPVDVSMTQTVENPVLEKSYFHKLMSTFIAQQTALNKR